MTGLEDQERDSGQDAGGPPRIHCLAPSLPSEELGLKGCRLLARTARDQAIAEGLHPSDVAAQEVNVLSHNRLLERAEALFGPDWRHAPEEACLAHYYATANAPTGAAEAPPCGTTEEPPSRERERERERLGSAGGPSGALGALSVPPPAPRVAEPPGS